MAMRVETVADTQTRMDRNILSLRGQLLRIGRINFFLTYFRVEGSIASFAIASGIATGKF